MKNLEGQVAIITGGGSGIGRGIALALAKHRVRAAVCGRRLAPLQETVAAMDQAASQSGLGLAVPADVALEADIERLVKATFDTFGRVDILVNNAGVSGGAVIHAQTTDDWDRLMAINLRGPFLMARAVLPLMRAQRSGHIINISSESGLEHYPSDGAYGVSKHALNALSEYIQRENQELGIRVNTVCPGMVVTEMSENSPGLIPSNCLYPEDIADLVVWLLTRRDNIKIGGTVLIQTMLNPWE